MSTNFQSSTYSADQGCSETTTHPPLNQCVEAAVKAYFEHLEGHPAANLYEMLLSEVEAPLLKVTLEQTNGNQTRAAEILGLNRGTLRKKLKIYGLS